MMAKARPDYGQDAPGVQRMMMALGAAGLLLAAAGLAWRGWSGGGAASGIAAAAGVLLAAYGLGMAGHMRWSSRVGKIRRARRLIARAGTLRPWQGDETVIDVGCGRGLMMIAAARELTGGKAIGFDIWRGEDQSGNSPAAALANASLAGVAQRVEVRTGDARDIPLADASADAVLSHWVVHNIEGRADREKAVAEMWRILRPGGVLVLADIAHCAEYREQLLALGAQDMVFDGGGLEAAVMNILSGGSYKPQALICRRAGAERG